MKLDQSLSWVAWNIFLATIPVVLAYSIAVLTRYIGKNPVIKLPIAVLGIIWLVFLPNTCYLLTEWRHFFDRLDAADLYLRAQYDRHTMVRLMAYTVFYFFYSGIGMLFFALAIRPIARVMRRMGANLWVYGALFFLMISLGVYLGLILRFNSWDLAKRPAEIWASILELAFRPRLSAFLIFFAGFLWITYAAIDMWIDGIKCRLDGSCGPFAKEQTGMRNEE